MHDNKTDDYDKILNSLDHDESYNYMPSNDKYHLNNQVNNIQGVAPFDQNKLSTRKMIYLTKRREIPILSNINEDRFFGSRSYFKHKPKKKDFGTIEIT